MTIQRTTQPSLDEVAQARPHRGSGAPARTLSHKDAILDLLRRRGPQGVLSSELYNCPERFGRSPRNRVSELRAEGCLIAGQPRGVSDWHYVLLRDSEGVKPLGESADWFQQKHGARPKSAPSDGLPLFSGAQQ